MLWIYLLSLTVTITKLLSVIDLCIADWIADHFFLIPRSSASQMVWQSLHLITVWQRFQFHHLDETLFGRTKWSFSNPYLTVWQLFDFDHPDLADVMINL